MKDPNFTKRLLTGTLLVIILFLSFYLSDTLLLIVLGSIAIIGLYEWTRVKSNKVELHIINTILIVFIFLVNYFQKINLLSSLFIIILIIFFKGIILNDYIEISVWETTGFLYVVMPFLIMLNLRNTHFSYLPLVFAFVSDTSAYLVGSILGKHKLSPKLSPNKSVEGALGAIVVTVIVFIAFNYFLFDFSILQTLIFGASLSITAQLGDLFASKIKRLYNIKDYGSLLPGHGGILDRFDSVLPVAMIIYIMYSIR